MSRRWLAILLLTALPACTGSPSRPTPGPTGPSEGPARHEIRAPEEAQIYAAAIRASVAKAQLHPRAIFILGRVCSSKAFTSTCEQPLQRETRVGLSSLLGETSVRFVANSRQAEGPEGRRLDGVYVALYAIRAGPSVTRVRVQISQSSDPLCGTRAVVLLRGQTGPAWGLVRVGTQTTCV